MTQLASTPSRYHIFQKQSGYAGTAVASAESLKQYQKLVANYILEPFKIETQDSCGPSASAMFKQLCLIN